MTTPGPLNPPQSGVTPNHPRRLARGLAFLLLIALATLPVVADSLVPGVLDDRLAFTPGTLETLTPHQLTYLDPQGTVQQLDRGRVVRWSAPEEPTPSAKPLHDTLTASHLVTTDGQAWLGTLVPDQNQPEALGWSVTLNGEARTHAVPLERIRSVRFVRGKLIGMPPADPDAPPQDRVLLQGGQVLTGFLAGLTADAVELLLDDADQPVAIPLDTVHLIELANPATPPLPGTDYARLADGQRYAVQQLRTDGDAFIGQAVSLTGDPTATRIPRDRVTAIDFHADGLRLVPLADLPLRIDQPAVVFGVPYPPAITADTAELHAPLRITLELPPGTSRFAARLDLDLRGLDPTAARWADLIVRVSSPVIPVGVSPQLDYRLNADQPTAQINLPIGPGPITLTLDPAANGPVLDRLRLTGAHALIRDAK